MLVDHPQLSVIPHLTLYGDVKPEQIKRTLLQQTTDKLKLLPGALKGKPAEASSKEVAMHVE